ncbi:MAG: MFS transporter [Thermoanaerobaculia bacterium]|nr:MFS transporter [Thermoanaerobaculia bacterium]
MYAWFVVAVLTLIYVNSFLDRQILGLLVDPIRGSLGISESQMGFIMGPAFGIFYIFAGIPLGRLADVMARRWLIFIGQLFWSLMSVGCGLVRTYPAFLTLRMGLGVGEASLSPAAYSSITDLFPPRQLARALSVYGMGISIGAGIAQLAGGLIIGFVEARDTWILPVIEREIFSWQVVFFFIAAPTIPLSILLLSIREPKRRGFGTRAAADRFTLGQSLGYIWQNRATMGGLCFGLAFLSFSGYGVGAWMPSHFIRNLGWSARDTGVAVGTIGIVCGASGMLFGGWLADRLYERGVVTSKITVALISCTAWFPFGILYPLMPTGMWTLILYAPAVFIAQMPWGVGPAAVQEIMPNRVRGQASAIYLFIANLLGLGFGPFIMAVFTQYVFKDDTAVRLSILVVPVAAHVLSAGLLVMGMRSFRGSLARLERWYADHA